jgi:hypothetical protein
MNEIVLNWVAVIGQPELYALVGFWTLLALFAIIFDRFF